VIDVLVKCYIYPDTDIDWFVKLPDFYDLIPKVKGAINLNNISYYYVFKGKNIVSGKIETRVIVGLYKKDAIEKLMVDKSVLKYLEEQKIIKKKINMRAD